MATAQAEVGIIAPVPSANQVDAVGSRSAREIAREVVEQHMAQLRARRSLELTWEKYLLHVDGSGDNQWLDIFEDTKLVIPRYVSSYRKTENLLRPIVQNAVAQHTTTPLRYAVDASPDRRAQERAIVDTLWANHVADEQNLNALLADALNLAMCTGFCPVHVYWREDVWNDEYEAVAYGGIERGPAPGMLDIFVGNPFDTVFNPGATRNNIRWCSYGRLVNADAVREAFGRIVPDVLAVKGSTRLPSAAEFQRIARSWLQAGVGVHGSAVVHLNGGAGEEMFTLICREDAPTRSNPLGRLRIVLVPGEVDARMGKVASGNAILLVDQPLPAGCFSWTLFYSHHRFSDVHGKPWVEDLDPLQVDLNIALSKRWEHTNKMAEAPIIAPGGMLGEDMMDIGGYNVIEYEAGAYGSAMPRVMEWPSAVLAAFDREVADRRQSLFRLGGYQAVSRGEAPGSRTPFRAIALLQQADSTVHGPVNIVFRRSACDLMQRCWRQFKAYGDVPWLIRVIGDEYAHLAEPYVDNTKVSEYPPKFKLVNAFGANPEMRAQEMTELVRMKGADGQPLLRTDEFRKQYPNQIIFDDDGNPRAMQRRRARFIATKLHTMARQIRQQMGVPDNLPINHPMVVQAAQQVYRAAEQIYPRLRDDDLGANIAELSAIAQDETADPIARVAAIMRQQQFFAWQQMMAAGMGAPMELGAGGQMQQMPPQQGRPALPAATGAGGQTGGAMGSGQPGARGMSRVPAGPPSRGGVSSDRPGIVGEARGVVGTPPAAMAAGAEL